MQATISKVGIPVGSVKRIRGGYGEKAVDESASIIVAIVLVVGYVGTFLSVLRVTPRGL